MCEVLYVDSVEWSHVSTLYTIVKVHCGGCKVWRPAVRSPEYSSSSTGIQQQCAMCDEGIPGFACHRTRPPPAVVSGEW